MVFTSIMRKHIQIILQGQVERQGNRFQALRIARTLNITGTVAEEPGRIIIEAEGEEAQLNMMVDNLRGYLNGLLAGDILIAEKELAFYNEFRML